MAKKIVRGVVTSDTTDKTIVVKVTYQSRDKRFLKTLRRSKNIMAHDAENKAKVGDTVEIEECKPFSKQKRFQLLNVLQVANKELSA